MTGHDIEYTCIVIDAFFRNANLQQKLKLQEYIDNKPNPAQIAEIGDTKSSHNTNNKRLGA